MKTKRQHRWLALALSLCMLAGTFPPTGMAAAAQTGCPDHQTHDAGCGYVAAVAGQPCTFTHVHDAGCGYAAAQAAVPCAVEAVHTVHDGACGGDPETGAGCTFAHAHDASCGYAAARAAVPCAVEAAHQHDDACGYRKAAADQPCTHSCAQCPSQSASTPPDVSSTPPDSSSAPQSASSTPPDASSAPQSASSLPPDASSTPQSGSTDKLTVPAAPAPMLTNNDPLYSLTDIAAVNAIIDAHPELGWPKADTTNGSAVPPEWAGGVGWSNSPSDRRVTSLTLTAKGLTGTLDLSALTGLSELYCANNQLTGLELSALTGLSKLYCEYNQLTKLDLSGLVMLNELNCNNNPIQSLKLDGGYTLEVPAAAGGTVKMTNFVLSSKSVTLAATAALGCAFQAFQFSPWSSSSWTNPATILLPAGGLTVTPVFLTRYNAADVAAINAIIDNNGLNWPKADPVDGVAVPSAWSGVTWSNRRATGLSIYGKNLQGTLDVSSLTGLTSLSCQSNGLTALNVTGLTSLKTLNCSSNELTVIDGLETLTSLDTLRCDNNQLTALDVSSHSALNSLYCQNNVFQSFKLDGYTLLVPPVTGGTVKMTAFNLQNKSVTLQAVESPTYAFTGFQFAPQVSTSGTTDRKTFTLPTGTLTVTPAFTKNPNLYSENDVIVLNAIADAHPELGWQKADPADGTVVSPSWAGSVDWSADTKNRRVTRLNLTGKGLTGTLDVSGLTGLEALHCGQNQLEQLNGLGTLTKLTALACPNNLLTKLEGLEKLTELKTLMCQTNQLTALDGVENLTQLMWLDCGTNQLTALDVSALKDDLLLYLENNPIQSLKLAGGYTLLVPPAANGSVKITAFNYGAKRVALSATADAGYALKEFQPNPAVALTGTNPVAFTLPGGVLTVTPEFIKLPLYAPADIAVLNAIADAHPELGWQKADPADGFSLGAGWTGIVWSNSVANQRVTQLDLSGKGLTGTLDVSQLTALTDLSCGNNQLTALDASGLTSLNTLTCHDNPLQSLKLNGYTLLVPSATGGAVGMTAFDLGSKSVTLSATANAGYVFKEFQPDPAAALTGTNPATFTLTAGVLTVTPAFTKLPLYAPADIAALNGIVDAHPELGWQKADPADGFSLGAGWTGIVWSNSVVNQRVTQLDLSGKGLTGTLDVSQLTALTDLSCGNNQLTALDASSLTGLNTLTCHDNPLQSLKLNGYTLLVPPAAGGTVEMTAFDLDSKSVTLSATANAGYVFKEFQPSPAVTLAGTNPAAFTLPGGVLTVTPEFTKKAPATYPLTVQAGAGGKITQGAGGAYAQGAMVSLQAEADAGYVFDGWTASNGGSFANAASAVTVFTMPGNATTITANFKRIATPDPTPSYTWQTLTHQATGVKVSGLFTSGAALEVKEMLLHAQGDCAVCDDIRARQDRGELIVLFDIALASGAYQGDLKVEIPVGGVYDGQTAIMLHCKNKVLESRTVTVSGGVAADTFSSLSPFAVVKVPSGGFAITGLPGSYTLLVGRTVSWTPVPAGGTWSYDAKLLSLTRRGDTYTFKALKEGKATATYTVAGIPYTVSITINAATIPQTGVAVGVLAGTLAILAALAGCGLLAYRRRGCKRRHE